jgi:hypothetical protein
MYLRCSDETLRQEAVRGNAPIVQRILSKWWSCTFYVRIHHLAGKYGAYSMLLHARVSRRASYQMLGSRSLCDPAGPLPA